MWQWMKRVNQRDSIAALIIYCACALGLSQLSGCGDKADPGLSDEAKAALSKDADAKATGGACRHAGRALEDCYAMNPDAPRAAVFAGWKDMNDYMRDNKMDIVKPTGELPKEEPAKEADASASAKAKSAGKKEN